MAIKKTQLYSSLWASCDELCGGMDASQYKDYVLTLLFMKYVTDKYAGDPYAMIVVPEGGSFEDMAALKGNKDIDRLASIKSSVLWRKRTTSRASLMWPTSMMRISWVGPRRWWTVSLIWWASSRGWI